MLPPPYPAEGVEVRGGHRGRRGRGNQARGGGPVRVLNIETLQLPPQYNGGRQPRLAGASISEDRTIPPQGYKHNRGTAYIPFNIHDNYRHEVPARFIQVHMQGPNPYAIGRMMNGGGDSFCGEIHTAPVHDVNHAAEPLTTPMLRMLGANYPAKEWIDSALARVNDRSLTAEVVRFRHFEPRIEHQREQVHLMERRLEIMELEQNLCEWRLREAHTVRRIVGELVRDQWVMRYVQDNPLMRRRFLERQQHDREARGL